MVWIASRLAFGPSFFGHQVFDARFFFFFFEKKQFAPKLCEVLDFRFFLFQKNGWGGFSGYHFVDSS